MAGFTLTQARTQTADNLDDRNNQRWATTRLDPALQAAVSSCVSEYASNGGEQLDEEMSLTSTTAGLATLSIVPLLIREEILVDAGSYFFPVQPQKFSEKVIHDTTSRNLKLKYVREFTIPSNANASHPLIGDGATSSATWPAFDRWVCAVAALQLGVGDNDKRPGLERLEQMARASVFQRINTPTWRPLPLPREYGPWSIWNLKYVYQTSPTAPTIRLVRDGRWWGLTG